MKNSLLVIMMMLMMSYTAKAAEHKLNFSEPVKLSKINFKKVNTMNLSKLSWNLPSEKLLVTKR